jgi:uncharacterized protein (DUF305 family)
MQKQTLSIVIVLVISALLSSCSDSEPDSVATPEQTITSPVPTENTEVVASTDDKHTDMMRHAAMGTTGLASLKTKTGEAFDRAYLSQMIAHHMAAVQMAHDALGVATQEETKQEARKVIKAQDAEITQMTAWLKDWYKTTPDTEEQSLVNADMNMMMTMPITRDAMFYEMMIPHHEGAIAMSEIALKNAKRAEVKELAQKIIVAQKGEIIAYQKLMKNRQ